MGTSAQFNAPTEGSLASHFGHLSSLSFVLHRLGNCLERRIAISRDTFVLLTDVRRTQVVPGAVVSLRCRFCCGFGSSVPCLVGVPLIPKPTFFVSG